LQKVLKVSNNMKLNTVTDQIVGLQEIYFCFIFWKLEIKTWD